MSEPVVSPTVSPVPPLTTSSVPPLPAPPAEPEPIDFGEIITDLSAFRAQGMEGLGAKGIRLQPGGPGTEIFTVPHPLLISDAQNEALGGRTTVVDIAKILLNSEDDPDVYARFVKAGGQAGDIMIAWRRLGDGLDLPK